MDFENHTPYPALLFRTFLDEERMAAAAILRVTYRLNHGELVPSEDQPFEVALESHQTPIGEMEGDGVFYRGGTDVFLFGHACAPGERPVHQLDVVFTVDNVFRRAVRVFGDREWIAGFGGLQMSAPKPFLKVPLDLSYAYGGKSQWDGLEIGWPDNPSGKGLYFDEAGANNGGLPNIEEIDQLIRNWDDRPLAAGLGFCPMQHPQRLLSGVEADNHGRWKTLRPYLYNAAFPRMVAPKLSPDQRVTVEGVSHVEPIRFVLPPTPAAVKVRFGNTIHHAELEIDQLGVAVDMERVFITYRHPFRYRVRRMEKRTCTLARVEAPL